LAKRRGIYITREDIYKKIDHPNGTYDDSSYLKHGDQKVGNISPRPLDGQTALDHSVLVKQKRQGFSQRIAVEADHFIILDEQEPGKFHGHQRTWKELSSSQKEALVREKITDRNGRILKK
jgi:hypothetical protein